MQRQNGASRVTASWFLAANASQTVKVTFALLEPHAKRVAVSGEFNAWSSDTTFLKSPLFHADLLTGHEPAPRSGTLASAANITGERHFPATGWWFMGRQKDGLWKTALALPPGRHEYKFVVDGQWIPDPNAQQQAFNGHGTLNSVVEVWA